MSYVNENREAILLAVLEDIDTLPALHDEYQFMGKSLISYHTRQAVKTGLLESHPIKGPNGRPKRPGPRVWFSVTQLGHEEIEVIETRVKMRKSQE